MNRSLLLVICDFLLLSLLALARFDDPEEETVPEVTRVIEQDAAANQDLIDVLKLSLDTEQETRAEISSELESTREELEARAKVLAEREKKLAETQQTADQLAEEKARLEKQRSDLAKANEEAERERVRLAEQSEAARQKLEAAERDRVDLAKTLADVKESAATSTERLKTLQEELAEKAAAVDQLQEDRERLASEARTAELQNQALAAQLEVAQTEVRVVNDNLELARRDIELSREERQSMQETTTILAEGVGALAESTDRIREEVQRAQPMSANAIFDQFRRNKVTLTFDSTESGLLGSSQERDVVSTVFVRGENSVIYAMIPVSGTPLDTAGITAVTCRVQIGARAFLAKRLGVLAADPRILVLAMDERYLEGSGIEPYPLAVEPLKFPQAVLIDTDREYYGEVGFKIEPSNPAYLEMDSSIFSDLFGEFSPGKGDLVFSQTGALIGVMVNGQFAAIVPNALVNGSVTLGDAFSESDLAIYRSRLRGNERVLPSRLR
ncbi:MAG: hypothetical protein AAFX93_03950 [Verrucomicrobiota bacterium]